MKRLGAKEIVALGILTAGDVVISRFLSINAWNMKIGVDFIPVVIAACLFGATGGGIVAALSDLIGALLFPIGAYFPGFTLTAFLVGIVFGVFLKKRTFISVVTAAAIHQFVLSLLLNTLWISILYGAPFAGLLATRVVESIVVAALEIICIPFIVKFVDKYGGILLK